MMHALKPHLLLLLLPALLATAGAQAEARRDGNSNQALRKAQYLIQQLNRENTELQSQLTGLKRESDTLKEELEQLREGKAATEARLESSRDNNDKLVARIESDLERYKALLARYQEAVTTLRGLHVDNQHLVRAVQEREGWIDQCRGRNDDLFEANADLLKRYRDLAVRHKEPFTGIGKVKVENEYQEYRFKLEDLQVMEFESSVNVERHRREAPEQIAAKQDGGTAGHN